MALATVEVRVNVVGHVWIHADGRRIVISVADAEEAPAIAEQIAAQDRGIA